jgi:hypothetical protein
MRYDGKDLAFDLPRDWEDKTVVAFAAPTKTGVAPNVVVTRDALGDGETLAAYADRQLVELAKRLDGFDLHHKKDLVLGGHAAIELSFGWQGQSGPLEQRLVMAANRARQVSSFTTTTAKVDVRKNDPIFDRILLSVRFADGDLHGAGSAPRSDGGR